MSRRVGAGGGGGIDIRILVLLGILVIGAVIFVVVLLFGGGGSGTQVGQRQPDDGGGHTNAGCQLGNYSSNPPTSGCHDPTPLNWGAYTTAAPANVAQAIHNLEHGGVVIWYVPGQVDETAIQQLTDFVRQQNTTNRFKVIVSPWTGANFGHAIAVTAWNWLLYQDTLDLGQVRDFISDHYQHAPESGGGPGPPG